MGIVLVVSIVVLGAAAAFALFLLWLYYHPAFIVKKMRSGLVDGPDSMSYPEDYAAHHSRVHMVADLVYPSIYPDNSFDLYLPAAATPAKPCPLVLWVHGGSFVAGTKEGVVNLTTIISAAGYAVLAPNYAAAPENPYPAAIIQMQELCAHLPAVAKEYGQIDLSRVFLAGDSAGAQIAAQYAAIETNPDFAKEMGLSAQLAAGSLRGVLLSCGPYDLHAMSRTKDLRLRYIFSVWGRAYFGKGGVKSEAARQIDITRFVTRQYPPAYITDGNTFSFEASARRLTKSLQEQGVSVQTRFFPLQAGEVPHEYLFLLARPEAQLACRDIIGFLAEYAK